MSARFSFSVRKSSVVRSTRRLQDNTVRVVFAVEVATLTRHGAAVVGVGNAYDQGVCTTPSDVDDSPEVRALEHAVCQQGLERHRIVLQRLLKLDDAELVLEDTYGSFVDISLGDFVLTPACLLGATELVVELVPVELRVQVDECWSCHAAQRVFVPMLVSVQVGCLPVALEWVHRSPSQFDEEAGRLTAEGTLQHYCNVLVEDRFAGGVGAVLRVVVVREDERLRCLADQVVQVAQGGRFRQSAVGLEVQRTPRADTRYVVDDEERVVAR